MPRLQIDKQDLVLDNDGVEVRLSRDYSQLEQESMQRLRALLAPYPKTTRFLDLLLTDPETRANWDMADYLVVVKLGFNDHGEVHHKVVATAAASLLQLLVEGGVQPDVVTSGAGDLDDAFLVTVTAALLHDIGNQVHRVGHPAMSVVLAVPVLGRLLAEIYEDAEQRFELRGFILHAIHTHDIDVPPLTLEAGIVAVADACDMTKGRSRYAFDTGTISIHSVGGLSIERVVIAQGQKKPVRIRVELSNSAGIFPVEEYLVPKVNAGALAPHVEVVVSTSPEESRTDQRILYTVEMEGKRFVARARPQPAPVPAAPVEALTNGRVQ
jgi:metal-dependent HD superfamily phosphatase/phosphodiesterase